MNETKVLSGKRDGWFKPFASISINVIAAFLQSVAMGMCAIIFPVALQESGVGTSMIGMILAMDSIAAFLGALFVSAFLRSLGMKAGMIASGATSAVAIMSLALASGLIPWSLGVFINGLGSFMFIMLLQLWINGLDIKKRKGLTLALYSTLISIGLAAGPVLVNQVESSRELIAPIISRIMTFSGHPVPDGNPDLLSRISFYAASLVSATALVPVLAGIMFIPDLQVSSKAHVRKIIMGSKGPMFALAMGAVSVYGVTSFITLYGYKNGLSINDSALLLTFFLCGTIALETPLSWISDYVDRRYIIVFASFACLVFAVYLPMAIYYRNVAWTLLFFWGGVTGCIYSTSMALITDKYQGDELVAANSGYSIMESIGGAIGVLLIGFFMDIAGTDGLPYVIMFTSILYFSFALTRYEVR